jgi:hypothetical protein
VAHCDALTRDEAVHRESSPILPQPLIVGDGTLVVLPDLVEGAVSEDVLFREEGHKPTSLHLTGVFNT